MRIDFCYSDINLWFIIKIFFMFLKTYIDSDFFSDCIIEVSKNQYSDYEDNLNTLKKLPSF